MVLVLLSCVMGRQDYHKEELWLFTVLYDYRSASDLTFGYPGSDIGFGKASETCRRDEETDFSEKV